MYKVIIIDDEPVIVTGLTKLLPWEKYECQVVGTAYNGEEGLELIRKEKPDIIFSDIYMPKMNGLLMAAAIRSEYEQMEITILTGYRDFDYLQEALKLGVTRYILKPSGMKELEEALETMTGRLKKKGILPDHEPFAAFQEAELIPADGVEEDELSDLPEDNAVSIMEKADQSVQGEDEKSENAAGSFIVRKALEYMKENYQRKISLKEVADQVYVSQWHLSKLLNRHEGKNFLEIINHMRIERAKELLADPSLRIGDVAEEIGFMDLAHFSRVFKKIVGVSANEYRNRLK